MIWKLIKGGTQMLIMAMVAYAVLFGCMIIVEPGNRAVIEWRNQ